MGIRRRPGRSRALRYRLLAVAVLASAPWSPAAAEPIVVEAAAVALDPTEPDRRRVGRLIYRGGLALVSAHRGFGGFSDLHVDAAGRRLLALSDNGTVLSARLVYDGQGDLAGVGEAALRRLIGPDGRALPSKFRRDAEAMAADAVGGFYVGFEHDHRIWHYPAATPPFTLPPTALPMPPGLDRAPANGGIEALAAVDDHGTLLALTERLQDGDRGVGWVGGRAGWARLGYRRVGIFQPTAAARLPSGGLLVLERGFVVLGLEISARLLRLDAGAVRAGATLAGEELARLGPPLSVDNMEGVAARRDAAGRTLVYLISDDNFSRLQRTLLMMFELAE